MLFLPRACPLCWSAIIHPNPLPWMWWKLKVSPVSFSIQLNKSSNKFWYANAVSTLVKIRTNVKAKKWFHNINYLKKDYYRLLLLSNYKNYLLFCTRGKYADTSHSLVVPWILLNAISISKCINSVIVLSWYLVAQTTIYRPPSRNPK